MKCPSVNRNVHGEKICRTTLGSRGVPGEIMSAFHAPLIKAIELVRHSGIRDTYTPQEMLRCSNRVASNKFSNERKRLHSPCSQIHFLPGTYESKTRKELVVQSCSDVLRDDGETATDGPSFLNVFDDASLMSAIR